MDLRDSFYQFKNRKLADWFGCEWGETASSWGVSSFVNADGKEEHVEGDEILYFVFEGMPMGWSWALYFCQAAMCDACAEAVPTDFHGRGGVVEDGHPVPKLARGRPLVAVYVDNALTVGATRKDVELALGRLCAALDVR
eukprot:10777280-Karenia_brevis.AAC.1